MVDCLFCDRKGLESVLTCTWNAHDEWARGFVLCVFMKSSQLFQVLTDLTYFDALSVYLFVCTDHPFCHGNRTPVKILFCFHRVNRWVSFSFAHIMNIRSLDNVCCPAIKWRTFFYSDLFWGVSRIFVFFDCLF